jgi:uncharacterized protein (TIGR02646 family)
MIYVNLFDNPPPQDWIDRADALTQQLIDAPDKASRDVIIHRNRRMWTEIKQHLSDIKSRKCWYTESINDGTHAHVDHFRPKNRVTDENKVESDGYWWLAFDWRNYRFSGQAPNVRKRDFFHVNSGRALNYGDDIDLEDIRFLDPVKPRDPDELVYTNEGKVEPKNKDKTSRGYIRAEYTIRRMFLDKEGLVEGRRDKYRKTSNLIREISNLLKLQTANFSPARENKIEGKFEELIRMASSTSEYSAAARYCLKSSGYDWALSIIAKAA